MKRTFTQDELEDLGLPYGGVKGGAKILATEDVEEARWGTRRIVVFEHDSKVWAVQFYDPATEMQEGMDIWEEDPVVATEMRPEQVTVTRWVAADD